MTALGVARISSFVRSLQQGTVKRLTGRYGHGWSRSLSYASRDARAGANRSSNVGGHKWMAPSGWRYLYKAISGCAMLVPSISGRQCVAVYQRRRLPGFSFAAVATGPTSVWYRRRRCSGCWHGFRIVVGPMRRMLLSGLVRPHSHGSPPLLIDIRSRTIRRSWRTTAWG